MVSLFMLYMLYITDHPFCVESYTDVNADCSFELFEYALLQASMLDCSCKLFWLCSLHKTDLIGHVYNCLPCYYLIIVSFIILQNTFISLVFGFADHHHLVKRKKINSRNSLAHIKVYRYHDATYKRVIMMVKSFQRLTMDVCSFVP